MQERAFDSIREREADFEARLLLESEEMNLLLSRFWTACFFSSKRLFFAMNNETNKDV